MWKSWVEIYLCTADVWESCNPVYLVKWFANASGARLVLQELYLHWCATTLSRWRAQRHFFSGLHKIGGWETTAIDQFALTNNPLFPYKNPLFSWGDVQFEMLMAQKPLSLLSHFMVLFEGENFPACGWDNREMLSGGIFHSTWPYAIKGQFGHTSQWTWKHQSFAGLMWKSKCFNSSPSRAITS